MTKICHGTIVIAGASSGIGGEVAKALAPRTRRLIGVARRPALAGEAIEADLTSAQGIAHVTEAVGESALDALLYLGGTWEQDAFTDAYDFATCADEEMTRVLNVNLLAPIRLTQALLPALRRSDNPKIVFMGALSGLDNFPGREVANSASKFGLRGAVHALRESLRTERIGVTVINPGYVGTPHVLAELERDGTSPGEAIPMTDMMAIIECVLSVSRSTCIKEIQVPAMADHGA